MYWACNKIDGAYAHEKAFTCACFVSKLLKPVQVSLRAPRGNKMKVGDLVHVDITGLGKPRRQAMGMLIKPIAKHFWAVRLIQEHTFICCDNENLEPIK